MKQSNDFIQRLAKALASQFGENCEVVYHDLSAGDPDHTVAVIENGHVSKRRVGDGPSRIVLEALKEDNELQDRYNYLTKTKDGRILRSSTVYTRDADGKITGILAINYDITGILTAQGILNDLAMTEKPQREPENIPTNVNELLDDLIQRSVDLIGKPAAMMTKDEKIRAIKFLNDAGAMLITRSGDRISSYFGISKYTLYAYLDAKS